MLSDLIVVIVIAMSVIYMTIMVVLMLYKKYFCYYAGVNLRIGREYLQGYFILDLLGLLF